MYEVKEVVNSVVPNVVGLQVHVPNQDYDNALALLKQQDFVLDVEPVIGDSLTINVSWLFYVQLRNHDDYPLLVSMASKTGTSIEEEILYSSKWYELRVGKNSSGNSVEVANMFMETGRFANVDPGFILHVQPCSGTVCVTDSSFDEQWGMNAIKACSAWKITKGDTSVRVAVIDMGIDENHKEFDSTHVVCSYDAETNNTPANVYYTILEDKLPPSPASYDTSYHGIHVGGIIFANHNRHQVAGLAPFASLVNISNRFGNQTQESIIRKLAQSIRIADSVGAKVINNSWGFDEVSVDSVVSQLLESEIDLAISHDRVVVFAAGNGWYPTNVYYPACCRAEIMVVGAIDSSFVRRTGSSTGPALDMMAPGVGILSTHNNNGYKVDEGTSMAAPHVSGVAALMLSINPNLTAKEVRDYIEQTAQKSTSYNYEEQRENGTWCEESGYGILDAHRAVLKAAFNKVYGDTNLTLCHNSQYTALASHNAQIDSVSFHWTCSDNLRIVSGEHSDTVTVRGVDGGRGELFCHVMHDGDTITSFLHIQVASPRTMYENISLAPNIAYPDTFVVCGKVEVDSADLVTWQNRTVYCGSTARLIVRPGGKLVVDGGTLTSACPGEMWQGIEVVGDRTKHQTAAKQGTVILRNSAVIEHAVCGIRTGLREDYTDFLTTGGIVQADTATFRNCAMDVMFLSYADTMAGGTLRNNSSRFNNCLFTVNSANHFAGTDCPRSTRVSLWDVCGVKFNGCVFRDSTTGPLNPTRAIYAEDAGFSVKTYCTAAPNQYVDCQCPSAFAVRSVFSGFATAVEADMSLYHNGITIDEALFTNNGTGVFIQGMDYPEVTRCLFDLSSFPTSSVSATGLRLDACTGYLVEQDTFHRNTYSSIYNGYGIWVSGSGPDNNLLYRNRFTNLNRAVRISGVNGSKASGLQCTCSIFTGDGYDIHVAASSVVASAQGDPLSGADNSFASTGTSSFFHAGTQTVSYFYSPSLSGDHVPSAPTSNIVLRGKAAANGCLSTLCNNGGVTKTPPAELVVLRNTCDSLIQVFENENYADVLADPTADTYNAGTVTAAQNALAAISGAESTLQGQSQRAVRLLLNDTVVDLDAVMAWLAVSPGITSRYVEAEVSSQQDAPYGAILQSVGTQYATAPVEQDEYGNYTDFNAVREALRTLPDGRINWLAATPVQTAELQRIAEANTGRSSAMAKGVLCFFFDICYDDVWDADVEGGTRRGASLPDEPAGLIVYPNPTDGTVTVESTGDELIGRIIVNDSFGRVVLAKEINDYLCTLDLHHLDGGMYFIQATKADGGRSTAKVIKN